MVLFNIKRLRILALFVAILSVGAISSNNASAVSYDTYTDGDGVVWDRETTDDGDIYIGIQSVPAGVTTVNVPSINDVASGKDTYFLDSICSRYTTPDCSGVVSDTANVTKLDMTNTSKIQVKNVSQMFDTAHEVELVFGENMVIADPADITITYDDHETSYGNEYKHDYYLVLVDGVAIDPLANPYEGYTGAFEGMKVKITNLGNIKYIGWNAFRNADLNAASRSVAVSNSQTIGGYIFAGSNVESLSVDTTEVGQGICKDCTSLSSLTIGDNVTTLHGSVFEGTTALAQTFGSNNITKIEGRAFKNSGITGVDFDSALEVIDYQAFMGTNLGEVVLGDNVKQVRDEAFRSAGLNDIDLKNVELLGSFAFAANNLTEVYMPKSFKTFGVDKYYYDTWSEDWVLQYTGGGIFMNNRLTKLTIAFDLYTNRTQRALKSALGCYNMEGFFGAPCTVDPTNTIEELILIAPYGENDEVSANRIQRDSSTGGGYDYRNAVIDSSKNIIGNAVFFNFFGLKKITIGEGYEYISDNAFLMQHYYAQGSDRVEELNLPSTLKGIGEGAFLDALTHGSVTLDSLPANLEYIGASAFFEGYGLTIDTVDLPKLKYLGSNAFFMVNIKNLTFRNALEYVGGGLTFIGTGYKDTLNITFDVDIYDLLQRQGLYNLNGIFGWLNASCGGLYFSSYSPYSYPGIFKEMTMPYIWPYNEDGQQEFLTSTRKYGKITFTDKATTPIRSEGLVFIRAEELDISQTPWTEIPASALLGAKIDTVKLPQTVKKIGTNAFLRAEVANPMTLPDALEEIGEQAFMAGELGTYAYPLSAGVNIPNLPASLKQIGRSAFYNDYRLAADMDLPNLEYLGASAFQNTNIRDVVLHDSITTLGATAFWGTPSLRNVTIDMDIYDTDNVTRTTAPQYDHNYYNKFVTSFGDGSNEFGTITFTAKAGMPVQSEDTDMPCDNFVDCPQELSYFYGIKADKIDLSATNWTTTGRAMFQGSEVGEIILPHALTTLGEDTFFEAELGDVTLPSTLIKIGTEAFQWATANISTLPEGLQDIDDSAFYGADTTDDMVVPSTVTHIGESAFNAGAEDVHYNTLTIKPSLALADTEDQLIFQAFWNTDVDKLIVESAALPATNINMADYTIAGTNNPMPEFHGMTMDEAVITNLPKISQGAFEDCANLKKVDLGSDAALRAIDDEAFVRDGKMDEIYFSPAIKNETVTIGKYAFEGTAFTTMGDSSKQFDLTAANFDATDGFAFSKMPKLETVDIPRNFSNKTVPEATFANDPELRLVTIDYKTDTIDNAAFSNDNKLESIFIWGNTEVLDENIAGHGGGEAVGPEYGPTIPEPTDIYAYSTSPAEDYAALPVRGTFEGEFYPLDEVLYLTSNKPTVLVNDDATDFDKDGLIVYAMRRDGIILESDSWATYDDNSYPRAESDINFEHMAEVIQDNPVFGAIHDTPVPMDELDTTTNVNFAQIDFTMVPDPDDSSIRKIVLLYNDKYTDNLADTDILPYQEGDPIPEPIVPDTGAKAMKAFMTTGLPIVSIVVISALGGALIYKKRRS